MIATESCAEHAEAAGEIIRATLFNGIIVGVWLGAVMVLIALVMLRRRAPPYVGDDDLPEHELGVGSS